MLKKTKIILFIASAILILTIIIVLITRSLNPATETGTEPVIPTSQTPTISQLTQSSFDTANKAKQTILPRLPIEITNFETSVRINTNILISSYINDSPDIVRIEIFGIDYLPGQNDPTTNPNMVAFKESFQKAIAILKENKIDIKNLHISLSNKQYIRDTAEVWIKILNLLP